MREVLPELMGWWRAGKTVGVGTVVATFRSAPRPPGASMLVGPDMPTAGVTEISAPLTLALAPGGP